MKFKPSHKTGSVVVEPAPRKPKLPAEIAQPTREGLPVLRLKKILVPLDFSESSKKALEYAVSFARQFDAGLTLLHVVEPYPPVPQMDPVDMNCVEDVTEKLKAVQADLEADIGSTVLIRLGNAHTEIVRAALELGTDLIVISTKGLTGLAHVFLGSTAEKVVRHASCPVLVVREHEHDFVERWSGQPAIT